MIFFAMTIKHIMFQNYETYLEHHLDHFTLGLVFHKTFMHTTTHLQFSMGSKDLLGKDIFSFSFDFLLSGFVDSQNLYNLRHVCVQLDQVTQ